MAVDLLTQLRDIHYPNPIPIWPLATGWYVIIILGLLLLMLVGYFAVRYLQKPRLKQAVLIRIEKLQQQDSSLNIAEELSMLLKRAALAAYSRREVASLHGEQWLSFLDRTAKTHEFSNGPGRLLIISPYQGKNQKLPDQLFELIKNWVKKNL